LVASKEVKKSSSLQAHNLPPKKSSNTKKPTKLEKNENPEKPDHKETSSSEWSLPAATSDLGRFDFSKLPKPPKRNEGGEHKEQYDKLHGFFLSLKSRTEKDTDDKIEKVPEVSKEQMAAILKENVEGLDSMLDRSGTTPVANFIISTYYSGLPLFKGNNPVQNHTIHAMRVIFYKVPTLLPAVRKPMFQRLAEAYSACQMEQGRVIDSIYGAVSGRDKTLKDQILSIVDIHKEQVLNQIINQFNPDAWKTNDDNPKGQIPHIQSSYTIALGDELGLRGVKAAKMDRDAFTVDPRNIAVLKKCFQRIFLVQDVLNSFIADVNQQEADANRLVDCGSLTKWVGDENQNNGFPPHSIFYDEDNPQAWSKEQGIPKEENKYKPFLCNDVTLNLFVHVCLKSEWME